MGGIEPSAEGAAEPFVHNMGHAPTAIEDAHIQQALDASQTAINAIGAVSSIASLALTVLGIGVAVIAIWGWVTITRGAKAAAVSIANKRLDAYILSPEFSDLVRLKVELSIKERWARSIVAERIVEDTSGGDDPPPFPSGETK